MKLTATSTGDPIEVVAADAARALTAGQKRVAASVGRVARKAVLDGVKARRGSLTLSGMQVTLGVRARTWSSATFSRVRLQALPAGPWSIAETGTTPHTVRARHRRALTTPGGLYSMVQVSGARGRRVWTAATTALDTEVGREVEDTFNTAWAGA